MGSFTHIEKILVWKLLFAIMGMFKERKIMFISILSKSIVLIIIFEKVL